MSELALDTTWGGETANSFVDFANANQHAASFLGNANWNSATRLDKHKALILAAIDICRGQQYIGLTLNLRQRLVFPRSLSEHGPLKSVPISPFSQDQKEQAFWVPIAQVKQAIHRLDLLKSPPHLEAQNKGLRSLSSGGGSSSVSLSFAGTGSVLSFEVRQILGPWKAARSVLRG